MSNGARDVIDSFYEEQKRKVEEEEKRELNEQQERDRTNSIGQIGNTDSSK